MTEGSSLWRALGEAFLFRWNLLLFGSGLAAGLLSGRADVVLPVLCALETMYLVLLVQNPRFRAAIDARAASGSRDPTKSQVPSVSVSGLMSLLEPQRAARFVSLRRRCLELRDLALGVSGSATLERPPASSDSSALDRLLWVFLRLLVSEQALRRFLASTNAASIEQQLTEARERLARAEDADERVKKALLDTVATAELRLANTRKAEKNAEFVGIELLRLEGKIQALAELSVSHEDPNYISAQVDSVAESMVQTEQAMRELEVLAGLTEQTEVPAILSEEVQG